jgi:hypothetical protein
MDDETFLRGARIRRAVPQTGLRSYSGTRLKLARTVLHWNGGWGGIRTHGTLARTPVFKTGALNRSATHPFVPVLARIDGRCNLLGGKAGVLLSGGLKSEDDQDGPVRARLRPEGGKTSSYRYFAP